MSITVKRIQKVNPRNTEAAPLHYLKVVPSGKTGIQELAKNIGNKTAIHPVSTMGVILALSLEIADELREGKSVSLGDLGTFSLSISSKGVPEGKRMSRSDIKTARINFRPGKELKDMLKALDFELV